MRTIIIEPYNPKWKEEFRKIKDMLMPHICDLVIDIIHVGSTSVEGLAAKPIIDFNIIIDSYDVFSPLVKRLEGLNYEYEGDCGVTGREAFRRKSKDEFMQYHLYVCTKDSREHLRQVTFRDYLRAHNEEAGKYAELKIQLAEQYRHDIDNYVGGKHGFVEEILFEAKLREGW